MYSSEGYQLFEYILFKFKVLYILQNLYNFFLYTCPKKGKNCFDTRIYLVLGEFAHLIH